MALPAKVPMLPPNGIPSGPPRMPIIPPIRPPMVVEEWVFPGGFPFMGVKVLLGKAETDSENVL
jgi:hypothetical protein